ncbi:MAG: hypothetical protein AB7H66_08025 [Hyphomonadaceae bacterium]
MSAMAITYVVGLSQAMFLVLALASMRVRNRAALGFLIALIVVFSVLLAEEALMTLTDVPSIGLGLAVEFAIAPLLFWFVRALYRGQGVPVQRIAPHFAPLVLASLVLVWLNVGFPGQVSLSNPAMRSIVAAIVLIKIVYFFAYAWATLHEPIPASASPERRRTLAPVRWLLAVFFAAYALVALSFIAFLLRVPLAPDSDIIGAIVIALSLYAIGYFSLVNRHVFDLRDRYADSPMTADEAAALRARAAAHLDAGEAFRDPSLNLNRVARAIGARPAQLSQALNALGNGGFSQLINQRRLHAYLADRARPENENKTVLELAFHAGFNSKATFYRVLRDASSGEGTPSVAEIQPKASQ